ATPTFRGPWVTHAAGSFEPASAGPVGTWPVASVSAGMPARFTSASRNRQRLTRPWRADTLRVGPCSEPGGYLKPAGLSLFRHHGRLYPRPHSQEQPDCPAGRAAGAEWVVWGMSRFCPARTGTRAAVTHR